MIDIQLNNNNAYKWQRVSDTYVIGHVIYKDKLLHAEQIAKIIADTNSQEEIIKTISEFNGSFAIVKLTRDNNIYLITDIVSSFPILYQCINDEIIITDNINNFKNKKLNNDNVQEFLALRTCSNDKTIYEDIYQVPVATIATIKENIVTEKQYFEYKMIDVNTKNNHQKYDEMYKLYDRSVKRLIEYSNGKTIVVPLSGGYDSRLIAYHLKQNNYDNVICYTYGRKNNPEYISAKKVADYLNYPLYFIEYTGKKMRQKYYNKKDYNIMVNYLGRGRSIPVIQEWIAIDELIKNNIIDKNCIVTPGYLGDFIAGGEIKNDYLIKNEYNTTNNLKDYILKNSYRFSKFNKETEKKFSKEIEKTLNIKLNDRKQNIEKITALLEIFDIKERESKYIVNAVRLYELYGLEWYLVYMDKDLMEYFRNIDQSIKKDRELYKLYVKNKYKKLLDYAPIASTTKMSNKEYKNIILKNINRLIVMFNAYNKNDINFYKYYNIKDYIKHWLNKRTHIISMIGEDYIKYCKDKK